MMADRLDGLKGAKCLVEAWEQKYGVGGHHTRWVDLRPSDVEWAVAEIEMLREVVYQYRDDLQYPPSADSIQRRLKMIDDVLEGK